MSAAAELLDRLGRPGDVRLGHAHRAPIPRLSTGLAGLDEALGGGLPRGRLTELTGPRSTGRTGLACAIARSATRAGETIAWVDPDDALDPNTAKAAGIALDRTLWVRARDTAGALRAAEIVLDAGGFGLVVLDLGTATSHGWPRLARAAERTRSTVLIVSSHRQAGTAAVAVEVTRRRVRWSVGRGRLTMLEGIDPCVEIVRNRTGRTGRTLLVRQPVG
jgi:recombination protein RecA